MTFGLPIASPTGVCAGTPTSAVMQSEFYGGGEVGSEEGNQNQ